MLTENEKRSVLQMVKAFLKTRRETGGCVSIEQYNKELDEAEKQIEAENFFLCGFL